MKFPASFHSSAVRIFFLWGPLLLSGLVSVSATSFEHGTYLKANNAEAEDRFGSSVAIDGDLAVVGAPLEDSAAAGVNGVVGTDRMINSGAAYVFKRSGREWTLIAHLKSPAPVANDSYWGFGSSVAVSGDLVAVGEPNHDGGRVHIFRHVSGTMEFEAALAASNAEKADDFGISVGISGQTLVVGAPGESGAASGIGGEQTSNTKSSSGAAYLFQRSGSTWSQQAYVKASNPDPYDKFGSSVAISGDTFVVGAPGERSSASGVNGIQSDNARYASGAAYVFVRTQGNSWAQQAYLKASNPDESDSFGQAVAIQADSLVIGAPGEDSAALGTYGNQQDNSKYGAGAAYVFGRSSSSWAQTAYLKPSRNSWGEAKASSFGMNVSVSGNLIAAGAWGKTLHLFRFNSAAWQPLPVLEAPDAANPMAFGVTAGVSGETVLIGDPSDASAANRVDGSMSDTSATASGLGAGAAYIFNPSLLESSAIRHVPAALTPLPSDAAAPGRFQLSWPADPGNRYDVKRSANLADWTSFPGFPSASGGSHEIFGTGPREFYRVVDIDATPPDGILSLFPSPGGFSVPRFADVRVELNHSAKVIPGSLKLTLGAAGPFTLANSPRMTYANGLLRYDVVDTALGAARSEVSAELVVGDTDGYITTYRWRFRLELAPVLVDDLFVFGSAAAQRAGQRFDAAQRAVAAATVGPVRLPASEGETWTLSGTGPDSITLSYPGTAPASFHAGQYLANDAPAGTAQIFYRRVTAVRDDPAARTLTLSTKDVPLTEIVQQGSASFTENSLIFQPDGTGTLIPANYAHFTLDWEAFGANYDGLKVGSAGGVTLSFRELHYTIQPSFFFSFDISWFELIHFASTATADIELAVGPQIEFNLEGALTGKAVLVPQKTIKTFKLGAIGILPIWMNADFSMQSRWGGTGQIKGLIYAGIKKNWTASAHVEYNKAKMRHPRYDPPRIEESPATLEEPEVTTEVNCAAWMEIEPRFDFLFEGLIGPYFSLVPRIDDSATVRTENGAVTYREFNASASAQVKMGVSIEYTNIDESWQPLEEKLFNFPWCLFWTPKNGWTECHELGTGDGGDG